MSKEQIDNTKNATKMYDYTAIADQLRTVSLSNTGLRAKPSHSPQQPCNQKDAYLKIYSAIRIGQDVLRPSGSELRSDDWMSPD